jgi:hypothetical protein
MSKVNEERDGHPPMKKGDIVGLYGRMPVEFQKLVRKIQDAHNYDYAAMELLDAFRIEWRDYDGSTNIPKDATEEVTVTAYSDYVTLQVHKPAYAEIVAKLRVAGRNDVFDSDGSLSLIKVLDAFTEATNERY